LALGQKTGGDEFGGSFQSSLELPSRNERMDGIDSKFISSPSTSSLQDQSSLHGIYFFIEKKRLGAIGAEERRHSHLQH
jgi:hypothetical protein